MNPREIEVHIEESVQHGFQPDDRCRIGDALEAQLSNFIATRGLPAWWQRNLKSLNVQPIGLVDAGKSGSQIASTLFYGEIK